MKNKIRLSVLCIIGLFLAFSGCKKHENLDAVKSETKSKNTLVTYNFDWENIDYMPAPAGSNILVPWASGANRSFPEIYATDIKKSDGWQLVYNTFSPTQFVQPAFFVLYNKYRGLLRGYFYLTPGSSIPSSNISHSLIQEDGSTNPPLLSYSATEVTNLKVKTPFTTTVQQYKTSATGTWYAAEFEMAYDPNITTKDAASTRMSWGVNSVNVTNITLNGVSQGTIQGTITQPAPSSGILGSTLPGLMSFSALGPLDLLKEPAVSKGFVDALKAGLSSSLQGTVKNVLNGIFGGSSQSTQYANLTTTAQINMSGTATDIYQLQNPSLIIPGTSGQNSVIGYPPLYNDPLGIMSLSSFPKLYFSTETSGGDGDGPAEVSGYSLGLDHNSYSIQFNPTIINSSPTGATIKNLKEEIVFFENYKSTLKTYYDNRPPIDEPIPLTDPTTEQIDNRRVIVNNLTSFNHEVYPSVNADVYSLPFRYESHTNRPGTGMSGYTGPANPELAYYSRNTLYSAAVLRISFDVTPNNGGPKSKIVKSFNLILSSWY